MLPISSNSLVLLAGLVAQATAATVLVAVGKAGLNFTPNEIQASAGDVIEFRFYAKNHSVVAGEFSKACVPATSGGFFSGFFPTAANSVNSQVFRVTINDTNPLPIYCAQNTGQHCHNGMVAVINPSSSSSSSSDNQTLAAYKSLAQQAGNAVSPASGPFGGVVAPNSAASGSSSGSSSTSSSSTTATAASGSATTTTTKTTTTPVTSSGGGGGGESSGTATATATSTSSASASASASGKPNAAGLVAAPLAGVVAAAAAVFFV